MDSSGWRRFFTALRAGLSGIRTAPVIFTTSVVTMTAGLFLLGSFLLAIENMRDTLERFGGDFVIYAFLAPGVDPEPERVAALTSRLEQLRGVEEARFVSRETALERLRRDLGDEADVLEGLPENPLPASFELPLSADARDPEEARLLAARVGQIDGIEDVRYGEASVILFASYLSALQWVGLVIGLGLFLVLSVIVGGTLRLAVYARSDEIEIQRLVGAGAFYVRLPFFMQGALQGGFGAGGAILVLYGLYRLALGPVLEMFTGARDPIFLGPAQIVLLVVVGVGLGVVGATLWLVRLEET